MAGGGRKGQEVPVPSGCCGCRRRGRAPCTCGWRRREGGRDKRSLHRVVVVAVGGGGGLPAHVAGGGGREEGTRGPCTEWLLWL